MSKITSKDKRGIKYLGNNRYAPEEPILKRYCEYCKLPLSMHNKKTHCSLCANRYAGVIATCTIEGHSNITWDAILGGEFLEHYKP